MKWVDRHLSQRSRRQHKASGKSEAEPEVSVESVIQPAERVAAVSPNVYRPLRGLRKEIKWHAILGLAPQALCFRPLRGLEELSAN